MAEYVLYLHMLELRQIGDLNPRCSLKEGVALNANRI